MTNDGVAAEGFMLVELLGSANQVAPTELEGRTKMVGLGFYKQAGPTDLRINASQVVGRQEII